MRGTQWFYEVIHPDRRKEPANKSNPDPTKEVWWGDQTWEEMMFTSLTFHMPPLTAQTREQR